MGTIATYEEKKKIIQKLNLTSDIFVGKVFEDTAALEEVLFLITKQRFQIIEIRTQYSIRQLGTHSVVLDVYAEDTHGRIIHIEIQNKENDTHLKRVRYCRSCIDTALLDKGVRYDCLPDILQIFITNKDFLGKGKAVIYNTKTFSDGVTEIFFNLKARGKHMGVIENLQKYFINTTEENESVNFPKLVQRVRFLKYEKNGVSDMCEVFDKIRQEGKEEGREEGSVSSWREAVGEILRNLGTLPDSLNEKIQEQESEKCLKDWFHLAMRSQSVEEFISQI